MSLTLYITLQKPPANVSFALQKGSGNNFESVQVQKSKPGEDLHFEFEIDIKGSSNTDAVPDFKGPYVQGPKDGRFIYIGIGLYAGVTGEPYDRRLKIPLSGITWQMTGQSGLQTSVPGTDKHGAPNCATVKPF